MILEAQGTERDCEVKEESDLELCLEHGFFFSRVAGQGPVWQGETLKIACERQPILGAAGSGICDLWELER